MKPALIIAGVFILGHLFCMNGKAQSITLTFSGIVDSLPVAPDSIGIKNLDKDCDTTLYYPNLSLILTPLSIGTHAIDPAGFFVFQNVPNPSTELSVVKLYQPESGQVSVTVIEWTGRQVASFSGELQRGYHLFEFTPGSSEVYIFSASSSGVAQTIKIVSCRTGSRICMLSYKGLTPQDEKLKLTNNFQRFTFSYSDRLRYTGYSSTYTSVIRDAPKSDTSYTFDFSTTGYPCPGIPTVDYGGQIYHTAQIGTQCWFKENLNIGTRINGSQNQTNNGVIEKYCYDDNEAYCDTYGGLYQWDELKQYAENQGVQGLCPDGWHIPTDAEWTTLTAYLGGESVAGGKMKEAGTSHWASPNTGATDSSGFTTLPGGRRNRYGDFYGLTTYAAFWSSTEYTSYDAWYLKLDSNFESVYRYLNYQTYGFSCRCLKN